MTKHDFSHLSERFSQNEVSAFLQEFCPEFSTCNTVYIKSEVSSAFFLLSRPSSDLREIWPGFGRVFFITLGALVIAKVISHTLLV
jgi:hypothetical protein